MPQIISKSNSNSNLSVMTSTNNIYKVNKGYKIDKMNNNDILYQTAVITHKFIQLFVVVTSYNIMLGFAGILSLMDTMHTADSTCHDNIGLGFSILGSVVTIALMNETNWCCYGALCFRLHRCCFKNFVKRAL